jgi:hypothetical protein
VALDNQLEERLQALMNRILDVKEQVSAVGEEQNYSTYDAAAARQAVRDVAAEYRAILDAAPEEERDGIDRRFGRQVIDLRRFASWLPVKTHGDAVPLAQEDAWTRAMSKPAPPRTPQAEPDQYGQVRTVAARTATPSGPRVGGEVDAWCGACKELRMHTIVAMVNNEPKQVICKTCDAKHGYRLTPARGKKAGTTPKKKRGKLTPDEAKKLKEEEERTAFQKELADAKDVRPFEKRARYKAGQFIDHPELGRGKIESVVKGSLVVRFRNGRRPVSLF